MRLNKERYLKCPESVRGGLERYIENRIEPGSFLKAVLSNDLSGAFGRADSVNRYQMFEIVSWVYNNAPGGCWGSKDKIKLWLLEDE